MTSLIETINKAREAQKEFLEWKSSQPKEDILPPKRFPKCDFYGSKCEMCKDCSGYNMGCSDYVGKPGR